MLRFELSDGRSPLPPIDVAADAGAPVVIGSAASAQIRLPAGAARDEHVRIDGRTWTLLADARIGGMLRAAGDSGSLGHGIAFELGGYRVRVSLAPRGATPSPPQRTESLARELARSLLGGGAAPSLEIERGPGAGSRRALAPPESALVIGRGDEATWVILDEDLSRVHAELRRGWDGVTVADLGSKNGTKVNGAAVGQAPVELRDGAALVLGRVALRFRDPAERHLRGEPPEPPARSPRGGSPAARPGASPSGALWPGAWSAALARAGRPRSVGAVVVFAAFLALAALAFAAAIWALVS